MSTNNAGINDCDDYTGISGRGVPGGRYGNLIKVPHKPEKAVIGCGFGADLPVGFSQDNARLFLQAFSQNARLPLGEPLWVVAQFGLPAE